MKNKYGCLNTALVLLFPGWVFFFQRMSFVCILSERKKERKVGFACKGTALSGFGCDSVFFTVSTLLRGQNAAAGHLGAGAAPSPHQSISISVFSTFVWLTVSLASAVACRVPETVSNPPQGQAVPALADVCQAVSGHQGLFFHLSWLLHQPVRTLCHLRKHFSLSLGHSSVF